MRPALTFFLYILGAYALAALLCVPFGDTLSQISGAAPHKLIGRVGLLLALIGFWPFLKRQGLANRTALGYTPPLPDLARMVGKGWLVGILILLGLSLVLVALGVRRPAGPAVAFDLRLLKVLAQGLLGGLLVGLIEETFFRGAMFSAIRRGGGSTAAAVALPALLYAALHFFKPQPVPVGAGVSLAGCLVSLGGAVPALLRPDVVDSFLALFLVGVFLALVRAHSGHIGWCIGLHAGWVLVIKLTHEYTDIDYGSDLIFLIGGYDGIIGWLAALWIGLSCLVFWLWARRSSGKGHRSSHPSEKT